MAKRKRAKQVGGERNRLRKCKDAGCEEFRLYGTAFCETHLVHCKTAVRSFRAKVSVSEAREWVGSLGA